MMIKKYITPSTIHWDYLSRKRKKSFVFLYTSWWFFLSFFLTNKWKNIWTTPWPRPVNKYIMNHLFVSFSAYTTHFYFHAYDWTIFQPLVYSFVLEKDGSYRCPSGYLLTKNLFPHFQTVKWAKTWNKEKGKVYTGTIIDGVLICVRSLTRRPPLEDKCCVYFPFFRFYLPLLLYFFSR